MLTAILLTLLLASLYLGSQHSDNMCNYLCAMPNDSEIQRNEHLIMMFVRGFVVVLVVGVSFSHSLLFV